MREIWKNIKNYEGLYQISNHGNVRRMRFINKTTNKKQIRILKQNDNGNGYIFFSLTKKGKRKNYYVHKLIANAFINNPYNYKEINHIDGNKKNNNISNLEWSTRSENVRHSFKNGLHLAPKSMLGKFGRNHPISKSIFQYDLNGKLIKKYESAHLASLETKICYASIKKCRNGNQKTAGGYIWKS